MRRGSFLAVSTVAALAATDCGHLPESDPDTLSFMLRTGVAEREVYNEAIAGSEHRRAVNTPRRREAHMSTTDSAHDPTATSRRAPVTRRLLLAGAAPACAVTMGAAATASAEPMHGAPADGDATGDDTSDADGPDGSTKGPHRPPDPSFEDVSVHDPSVIRADGHTYVFGSHLAAARSDDLLAWDGIADGVTDQNPLFEDVTDALAEALDWSGSDTLWAPDVQRTQDGRFRMYYNACEGGSPRSAMGTAVAETIEGPYSDEGIFLRSGMWDEPSEDGEIYDPLIHPNVVDPHAFVDAGGRHLLLYGSYSGGIFLLELDPGTGHPLPDQGYGVHLTGGNHARIEAPYMLHSRLTGYYYLLLTFGGLDADGGYNVRVGRSRRPEGPFRDIQGNDLREAAADPDLPLFDDELIVPFGAKLMGGHEWGLDRVSGAGSGEGTDAQSHPYGYVSPGHVSAWADRGRGGAFMVFRTRFPGRDEEHEVRVHRLHLTREGWPVLSPLRYAGEGAIGSRDVRVTRREIAGRWRFIDHGRNSNVEPNTAQEVELGRSGRISGAAAGSWRLRGGQHLILDVDGTRFSGVLTRGWNEATHAWTPVISALAADGRALWGMRV